MSLRRHLHRHIKQILVFGRRRVVVLLPLLMLFLAWRALQLRDHLGIIVTTRSGAKYTSDLRLVTLHRLLRARRLFF